MSNRNNLNMADVHYFLMSQIRHDSIIQYYQSAESLQGKSRTSLTSQLTTHSIPLQSHTHSNSHPLPKGRETVKQNLYSGLVTPGVKRRIRKKMDLLLQISPIRWVYNPIVRKRHQIQLSFLTFTIPLLEELPDHKMVMKKCFAPMLSILRLKLGVKDYVWKAELQKNGTIHYHLATNVFIDYTVLKSNWNLLLKAAGLLDKFHNDYGHYHPNSTDVRATKTAKGAAIYMSKYMAKNDNDERKINGKVWDCSLNLKLNKQYVDELSSSAEQELEKALDLGIITIFQSDLFQIFKIHPAKILTLFTPTQKQDYLDHITHIKNFKRNKMEQKKEIPQKSKSTPNPRLANTIKQATQTQLNIPPAWTKKLKS